MKIEKNIPIPKRSGGKPKKHPWYEMEVGDSVLIDKEYTTKKMASYSAMAITAMKSKGLDWKFSFRKTEEGLRCWRKQ